PGAPPDARRRRRGDADRALAPPLERGVETTPRAPLRLSARRRLVPRSRADRGHHRGEEHHAHRCRGRAAPRVAGGAPPPHRLRPRPPRRCECRIRGIDLAILARLLTVGRSRSSPPYPFTPSGWAFFCATSASSMARKQCAWGIAVSVRFTTSSTSCSP